MKKQFILTTLVIFILLTVIFYVLKLYAPGYRFEVLEGGNLIMALLSLSTYFIVKKKMNGRPQAFVTGVSGASLLKLMVCMISVLVYVMLNRDNIHKPSIFVLFGIYAIYTAMETVLLSKLARE